VSIRRFIFCEACNPQGIRCLELRRNLHRDCCHGRRWNDGRAWFEADLKIALMDAGSGWHHDGEGRHVCTDCFARPPSLPTPGTGARPRP